MQSGFIVLGGTRMLFASKLKAIALVGAFSAAVPGAAISEIFKGETAGVGGPVHTMFVAFSNQASKGDVEIQVNAGQTLARSMLKGAQGAIDFFSTVPSLVGLMARQQAMYANIENAPELSGNLRAILGFEAGAYHPVTLAGSGIETWEDIAGKTVFTGPPSGAASATSEAIIRNVTGLEAGTDYEAIRLSWGEGYTALADGKIDLMMRPAEIGSANIERFGLSGEFRVLSIPDEAASGDAMQTLFGRPGRGLKQFDGSIYEGQLTEGTITALGFFQMIGTHAGVSEDVVYNATKAFWENLDEVHNTAFFLQEVSLDTAFVSVNIPLHPGAIRYYEEVGVAIPDDLRP
jgi:TRAP transporter TAXI family solute receptor